MSSRTDDVYNIRPGPLVYFLGAQLPSVSWRDCRHLMITLEIFHCLARHALGYLPGTFMPAAYKKNQKELLAKVKEQYDGPPLEGPLRVEMDLYGEGRADIDNVVGCSSTRLKCSVGG